MRRRTAIKIGVAIALAMTVSVAFGATESGGLLDDVTKRFQDATSKWGEIITTYATWLFFTLAAISMAWTFGVLALRNADIGEFFSELIKFVVTTGFFWWVLSNGPTMAMNIIRSMEDIGAKASNSSDLSALSPSAPLALGLDIIKKAMGGVGFNPITNLEIVLISLATLVCMAAIAANILIAVVTGWVLAFAGIFILGFGGSRWTSDMAIGYFKAMLGIGLELMTIVLLMGIARDVINSFYINLNSGAPLYEFLVIFCVCAVLALLIGKIPGRVAALGGGGSGASVSGGSFASAAIAGAAAVASGGASLAASSMGGAQALSAAFKAASAAESGGSGGAGAMLADAAGAGGDAAGGGSALASAMGDGGGGDPSGGGSALASAMGSGGGDSSSSAGGGSSSSAGASGSGGGRSSALSGGGGSSSSDASSSSASAGGGSSSSAGAGGSSGGGSSSSASSGSAAADAGAAGTASASSSVGAGGTASQQSLGAQAAKAGRIAAGTAKILARGAFAAAQAHARKETVGGKIATAIEKAAGAPSSTPSFGENSISAGLPEDLQEEIAAFRDKQPPGAA